MQGMTLGPPAGEAIAEFVARPASGPQVLDPFALDRFRRLPRLTGRYDRNGG